MYGIFTYIWLILMVNLYQHSVDSYGKLVGEYTSHIVFGIASNHPQKNIGRPRP